VSYDWVFFDADGTLFDYDAAEAVAIEGAFRATGLPFDRSIGTRYSAVNSAIWREYEVGGITQDRLRTERFDRLFEELDVVADSAEFSRRYLEILGRQTRLLDGAESVVRALVDLVGLVLITNGLAEVQRPRFAASTIGDCFAEIVISQEEWDGHIQDMKEYAQHDFMGLGRTGKYRKAAFVYRGPAGDRTIEEVGFRTKGNASRTIPQDIDDETGEHGALHRAHFKVKFNESFDLVEGSTAYRRRDDRRFCRLRKLDFRMNAFGFII